MKSLKTFCKSIAITLLLIVPSVITVAIPSWTRVNYTSSTAFIGEVKINYYNPSFPITIEEGDFIGAFVGDECRMVAEVFSYQGKLFVSAVIHGGDVVDMTGGPATTPEEVEFRVWDNSANKFVDAVVYGTLMTNSAGEIFDYIIGKPNEGSELADLAVNGFSISPEFSGNVTQYEVSVPMGTELPAASAYVASASDSRATVEVTPATSYNASGSATTTITVTAEDGSETVYKVVFTQEACETVRPTTTEVVNALICEGESATLTATFASATAKAVWYAAETGGTPLFTGNSFATGETVTKEYTYYVAKNDGCESETRTKVTMEIVATPAPSIKGLKTSYCATDAAVTLSADVAGGTFTVNGVAATSFNPATAKASNEIVYSVTLNGCEGTATSTVAVNAVPTINLASMIKTVCADQTLDLPAGGIWSGTGVSGNSFSSSVAGNVDLTYSVTDANGCSNSEEVSIAVSKPEQPTAESKQIGVGEEVPALTASVSGTGSFKWYEKNGTIAISTQTSFTPTISTAAAEVFSFYVTNSENGCESAKTEVAITITSCATVAPEITKVLPICEGESMPTLSATGTNIIWYDALTGGNKVGEGATFVPTAAGTYYASQTNTCEGPRASAEVVVKSKPAKPALTAAASCSGESFVALKSDVKASWFDNKNGTALNVTPATEYTPVSLSATTTFYAKQTVDGCASDFAEVVYTFTQSPQPTFVGLKTKYCSNDDPVELVASVAGGMFKVNGVTETRFTPSSKTSNTITYSVAVNGCESTISQDVAVNAVAEPEIINLESTYCTSETTAVTLKSNMAGGTFTLDGNAATSFVPSTLGKTTHTVVYTLTDVNSCVASTQKVFAVEDCTAPAVQNIELSKTELNLLKGETSSKINVTITPSTAPETIIWESSNTAVATVDENGRVTAVGAGTATITATSAYTPTKSATCAVSVTAPVQSVSFNNTDKITIPEGGSVDLKNYLVIEPQDASLAQTSWSSSLPVATVVNGVVTAGTVQATTDVVITVSVTSVDGTKIDKTITVTISRECSLAAPLVAQNTQTICEGATQKVTFTASGNALADWFWTNTANATISTENSMAVNKAGTYYVYQVSGECVSPKTMVTLTQVAAPAKPVVENLAVCQDETGSFVAAEVLTWYSAIGEKLSTGASYSPTTQGTYYARKVENGCESAATEITYTINKLPQVNIIAPAIITLDDAPITISVSPENGTLSGNAVENQLFNPQTEGEYTLTYKYVDVNACENSTTHKITVTQGIVIDRTQLGDTIARANLIMAQYADNASYSAASKSVLQQAINVAQSYYDDYKIYTNAQLFRQTTTLSKAIQAFLDSKIPEVDVTALSVKVSESFAALAQEEYRKGNSVGNIPESSFNNLQAAANSANAIVQNPPKTQAEVNRMLQALTAAYDAFYASEVANQIQTLGFSVKRIYLQVGEEITPELTVLPYGATGDIVWNSSNSDVVWVYGSGKISAQKVGSVAITASSLNDPSIMAQLIVEVKEAPVLESVEINRIGNQIVLQFSEPMEQPLPEIYQDLKVYGSIIPIYNVVDVTVPPYDTKKVIISLGTFIDEKHEVIFVYDGVSLVSKHGIKVDRIRYDFGSNVAIDDVFAVDVEVFPTVATTEVTIQGIPQGSFVTINSADGRTVKTIANAAETEVVNVANCTAGTYYIVISNSGNVVRKAFVKK